MRNNKFITKFLLVFMMVISVFTVNVNAQSDDVVAISENDEVMAISEDLTIENSEGIFDVGASTGVYKYSDSKDIYLPFIRYSADRIEIDRKLTGFGTSFSGTNIEVNADIEGVQVLFANDSIRVNNKMEYGVLFATTNTTISSTIEKSLIVFSGEKTTITEDAIIKGDIICFGTDLEINGTVEGSVLGYASNVVVNGTVGKDLRVETNTITLGEESVKGNVYVDTYNQALTLPETYANSKINVLETVKEGFNFSIIYTAIITGAVFTLVYFLINKVTKNKVFENGLAKVKTNPIVVIFGGSISLMLIPAVLVILIMLSAFGLYMVAVPAMIIYFAFILVIGLLSTLIIGSLITEYMANTKYLKDKGTSAKYIFAFVMFIMLYVLARVPYVGGYVTLILVMFAIGATLCMLFCKVKNKNVINNNIENNNVDVNE